MMKLCDVVELLIPSDSILELLAADCQWSLGAEMRIFTQVV